MAMCFGSALTSCETMKWWRTLQSHSDLGPVGEFDMGEVCGTLTNFSFKHQRLVGSSKKNMGTVPVRTEDYPLVN
jgi:hypothetical protein